MRLVVEPDMVSFYCILRRFSGRCIRILPSFCGPSLVVHPPAQPPSQPPVRPNPCSQPQPFWLQCCISLSHHLHQLHQHGWLLFRFGGHCCPTVARRFSHACPPGHSLQGLREECGSPGNGVEASPTHIGMGGSVPRSAWLVARRSPNSSSKVASAFFIICISCISMVGCHFASVDIAWTLLPDGSRMRAPQSLPRRP